MNTKNSNNTSAKKVFIITEGEFDASVLKKILSKEDFDIKFGSGFSSALSKARSLLSQTNKRIILLLDTDSTDENEIKERQDFVNTYTSSNLHNNFKIIWVVPELEIIFLKNKNFIKRNLGNISNDAWELSKEAPKKALQQVMKKSKDDLLSILDNNEVKKELREDKIIKQILEFAEKTG